MPLLAAVQMNSGPDKAANLARAEQWVREAARAGADLVALPENFSWIGPDEERGQNAEDIDGPTLTRMSALAKELGVCLLAGSVPETSPTEGKFYNTSVLFGPLGQRLGTYRKIHLFDVDVHDGVRYRESERIEPGREAVVATSPLGGVGLSVCYDLRFPELYRQLVAKGAVLLTIPAAFTLTTGKDHWEVLVRARAIENQCYTLAPAQVGSHPGNRQTYGNALVVDPWGTVVARASYGEGLALGRMDLSYLEAIRTDLPCLSHRRL